MSQLVHQSIDDVFSFFSKPENLEKITPKYLKFNILTASPIAMKVGSVIDYTIRLRGIPLKWSSLITDYDPPYRFVDEQIKGPYSLWKHVHTFQEVNDGTIINDHIFYSIPFGIVGQMANYLFVKNDLDKIFNYRKEVINSIYKN